MCLSIGRNRFALDAVACGPFSRIAQAGPDEPFFEFDGEIYSRAIRNLKIELSNFGNAEIAGRFSCPTDRSGGRFFPGSGYQYLRVR
jgi:hypothetical protein